MSEYSPASFAGCLFSTSEIERKQNLYGLIDILFTKIIQPTNMLVNTDLKKRENCADCTGDKGAV